MSPWPQLALGELVSKSTDRESVSADQEYPNFGIYGFGRGLFRKPPIRGATSSAAHLYRARAGQFVYSRLFAFEGAYGVVTPEFDGCFVSNEFPLFDCDRTRVLPDYLGWYFRHPAVWPKAARLTTGMGSRRRRIKPEALLTLKMPVPELGEQQAIVDRLDRVSCGLREAQSGRQQIDDHALAMLRSRFARIASDVPHSKMREVAPLVRRKAEIRPDVEYPELGVRSFGRGTFHKPALDYLSVGSKKLYRIEPGDLVFNNVFAWEGAIAVAQPDDVGRFGSHRFITCIPQAHLALPEFLCFYFTQSEGLTKIGTASPGGAGRNRTLGLKKLDDIEVPLPPLDVQRAFKSLLRQVATLRAEQQHATRESDSLMPAILHRAFNGAEA